MSGKGGEYATAQSTNRGPAASPAISMDASFAASQLLSRPSPLYGVVHPARAAAASLNILLAAISDLEEQFRISGDAVAAMAHLPFQCAAILEYQNASAPSTTTTASISAQLLATLDALAGTTARRDAEVGQQLTSLRRGVAALVEELHSLSDRYPSLRSGTNNNNASNNSSYTAVAPVMSLWRTPHVVPSTATPNFVLADSTVTRISANDTSLSTAAAPVAPATSAAVVGAAVASSPGSPPQRPTVVTPRASPQLHAGSFGSRVGGGPGDLLRSPASQPSSNTTPVTPTTRIAAAATVGGPQTPTPPLRSHGRTSTTGAAVTTAQPSSAASSASPPLGCHFDRIDLTHLPTAQFPCSVCADSVKKYLANCVEWPPRSRRRNVRSLTPRYRTRNYSSDDSDGSGGGQPAASHASSDSGDDGLCEKAGLHTPSKATLQQELGSGDVTKKQRRATCSTAAANDGFLHRLTEESPRRMPMPRSTLQPPDTHRHYRHHRQHYRHDHQSSGNSPPSSDGSSNNSGNASADEGRSTSLHHSVSSANSMTHGYGDWMGQNGKRMRSRCNHEAQHHSSSATVAAAAKGLRHGRPTIVESVDALVLAQLRSDGIPLNDEMTRELRGCAVMNTTDEHAFSESRFDKTNVSLSVQNAHERNTVVSDDEDEEEMVQMVAVPKLQRHKVDRSAAKGDRAAVDFADVLQEVRNYVHHGCSNSGAAVLSSHDCFTSSRPFPSVPPTQFKQPQQRNTQAELKTSSSLSSLLPLTVPPQFPTTASWFAHMEDFCVLLDHLDANSSLFSDHSEGSGSGSSSKNHSDHRETNAIGTDAGGRAGARRSHTTTITATSTTHEHVSRPSVHTSSLSGTTTAASENDFSIEDELFTSAEEAGEFGEHDEQQEQLRVAASHMARPPTVQAFSITDQPPVHGSNSHRIPSDEISTNTSSSANNGNTNNTRGGVPIFSTASHPNPVSVDATAVAVTAGAAAPRPYESMTPASRDLTHINALEEFWREHWGVPVSSSASRERLGFYVSTSVGQDAEVSGHNGDRDDNVGTFRRSEAAIAQGTTTAPVESRSYRTITRPTNAGGGDENNAHIQTSGARVLVQRRQRQEAHMHRASPNAPITFFRELYSNLRGLHQIDKGEESLASHLRCSVQTNCKEDEGRRRGANTAECLNAQQQQQQLRRKRTELGSAPLMNYRAAARELRALCAVLGTDLTLLVTLQELSKLLTAADVAATAAAPTLLTTQSSAATECGGSCHKLQLSKSFIAATQLLLSVQEKHSMQARIQKELKLRGVTRSEYESAAVAPVSFAASRSARLPEAMTPLLLSSQHPVSALGYATLLARFIPASSINSHRDNNRDAEEEELKSLESESRLSQYISTVTPYLVAWHSGAAQGGKGGQCNAVQNASPQLPLSVWVYVEALTTELMEEARKLNALYDLFVLLLAEATLGVVDDACVHGGISELLLHHIWHSGRAVSVLSNAGVAGGRLSFDNGLEKFVTPVSTHLLRSFDRLDSRHLLHSAFRDVGLSDVVARRRALKQQQQALYSFASPSPSPISHPPPGSVTVQQQRQQRPSGRDVEGEEGEEVPGSFALPSGTLSSSPTLRSTAGVQGSIRVTEQQQQQGSDSLMQRYGGGDNTNEHSGSEEDRDLTTSSDALNSGGGGNAAQGSNRSRSTGSESRHAIIGGFVRYLTGGVERLRSGSDGNNNRARAGDDYAGGNNQNFPSSKATPCSSPHSHYHSGLTLDVPHTSALLKEQDDRMAKATSNLALLRAVDSDLVTQALVEDAFGVRGGLQTYAGLRAIELSKRRYFNACAAAFAVLLPPLSSTRAPPGTSINARDPTTITSAVVQCRWQPVFQSTMCFCPVTRRRCLDPLVCGALLVSSPLPPQRVLHTLPDHDQASSTAYHHHRNDNNTNGSSGTVGTPPSPSGGSPLPFPVTIRVLRSGPERAMVVRGGGGGLPIPGLSVRRSESAVREITVLPPPTAVIATMRNPSGSTSATGVVAASSSTTAPSAARTAAAAPARVESPMVSFFPSFLLRHTGVRPRPIATPHILERSPTTLYRDSSAVAWMTNNDSNVGEGATSGDDGENAEGTNLPSEEARRLVRTVTLLHEAPPITRNLLLPPEATQSRWLNPPTLLECGHVVAHKTYLDLRTTARRTTRTAAAAAAPVTLAVCCPYCSKVTPAKDALTLSYLY